MKNNVEYVKNTKIYRMKLKMYANMIIWFAMIVWFNMLKNKIKINKIIILSYALFAYSKI